MGLTNMSTFVNKSKAIRTEEVKNCSIVIDGNNLAGKLFDLCGNTQKYGGDYDIIGSEVKRIFTEFQRCGINSHVVFDGGHNQNSSKKKVERVTIKIKRCVGGDYGTPIFLDRVLIDNLKDMKIPYVMCDTVEADIVIAALAKHYESYILSNDSDLFMAESPVIIMTGKEFYSHEPTHDYIKCSVYRRKIFLDAHCLLEDKAPIIYLIQHDIYNSNYLFHSFSRKNNFEPHKRLPKLLNWLRYHTYENALKNIIKTLNSNQNKQFYSLLQEAKEIANGLHTDSSAFKYMVNPSPIIVNQNNWFENGLVLDYIAKPYVDLYRSKVFYLSPQSEDFQSDDSFRPCLLILRYAFDLLTEFSGESFKYFGRSHENIAVCEVTAELSVSQPPWVGSGVFHRGWDDLPDYFGHFLKETLPALPREQIASLPADLQLAMVALVWWRVHVAPGTHTCMLPHCMFLCWARGRSRSAVRSAADWDATRAHSLAQFRHVLCQLMYLRQLCAPAWLDEPRCERLFCGSFLYSVLSAMTQRQLANDAAIELWIKQVYSPNTFSLYCLLRNVYESCVAQCSGHSGTR